MELTQEQKKEVSTWVAAGGTVAEIQKRIQTELGVAMTYMDVRLLIDDLGAKLKDKDVPKPAKPDAKPVREETDEDDMPGDVVGPGPGASSSKVSIDMDVVTKPGAVVSGTVVFSDGVKATWALDTYGRLALSSSKPRYKPGAEDLKAFQEELGRQLRKRGY